MSRSILPFCYRILSKPRHYDGTKRSGAAPLSVILQYARARTHTHTPYLDGVRIQLFILMQDRLESVSTNWDLLWSVPNEQLSALSGFRYEGMELVYLINPIFNFLLTYKLHKCASFMILFSYQPCLPWDMMNLKKPLGLTLIGAFLKAGFHKTMILLEGLVYWCHAYYNRILYHLLSHIMNHAIIIIIKNKSSCTIYHTHMVKIKLPKSSEALCIVCWGNVHFPSVTQCNPKAWNSS